MIDAGQKRTEELAVVDHAADRNAAEADAVIAALAPDEALARAVAAHVVIGDRDLQRRVGRFRARVGEEDVIEVARREIGEARSELEGERMGELESGREIEFGRLPLDRGHDRRAIVARVAAPERRGPVKDLAALWREVMHVLGAGDEARALLEGAVRGERHPECREIVGNLRARDGTGIDGGGHAGRLLEGRLFRGGLSRRPTMPAGPALVQLPKRIAVLPSRTMTEAPSKTKVLLAKAVVVLMIAMVVLGLFWYGFSAEVRERIWRQLLERPGGPMTFRFLLQPSMAALAALHDGIRDARTGRAPYFSTLLSDAKSRGGLLFEGLVATGRVLLLGIVMDMIYQAVELNSFYPAEAVIVAIVLAFLPYALLRGPIARIARMWVGAAGR